MIYEGILMYFKIGLLWLVVNELIYVYQPKDLPQQGMSNGLRFRLFMFWPVTFIAFVIGIIEAFKNNNNGY
jgi:hypothetical protein